MTFHEKLRRRVAELGINKAKAAREVGLPESTISSYLAKEGSLPRIDIALKIARAIRVPLEWLADDSKDWPPPSAGSMAALSTDELRAELGKRLLPIGGLLLEKAGRALNADFAAIAAALIKADPRKPLPKALQELADLPGSIDHLAKELWRFDPATRTQQPIPGLELVPDFEVSLLDLAQRLAHLRSQPGYRAVAHIAWLWSYPERRSEEDVRNSRQRARAELEGELFDLEDRRDLLEGADGRAAEGKFTSEFEAPVDTERPEPPHDQAKRRQGGADQPAPGGRPPGKPPRKGGSK